MALSVLLGKEVSLQTTVLQEWWAIPRSSRWPDRSGWWSWGAEIVFSWLSTLTVLRSPWELPKRQILEPQVLNGQAPGLLECTYIHDKHVMKAILRDGGLSGILFQSLPQKHVLYFSAFRRSNPWSPNMGTPTVGIHVEIGGVREGDGFPAEMGWWMPEAERRMHWSPERSWQGPGAQEREATVMPQEITVRRRVKNRDWFKCYLWAPVKASRTECHLGQISQGILLELIWSFS